MCEIKSALRLTTAHLIAQAFYATTLEHPIPRFETGGKTKHAMELSWSVPGGFTDVTEVQIEFWQHGAARHSPPWDPTPQ